ncbi:MAG: histidine--tRNA ligase [Minisyncoccia bacterium]
MSNKLSTDSYKGVRDFYPEDQFVQSYIFSVWRSTIESFGYVEYGASILEPSEIYKEKSGEEIVKEQTFTFIDRGEREVTLRPEMTPTVARMVAAHKRDLGFPLRWYSIPNLFRYEAPQRGRLREHWQLNVDIFGAKNFMADVEIIKIAYRIMLNFGATDSDFEIRLNSHSTVEELNKVISELNKEGINNMRIDETLARGQAYYTGVVFELFDTNSTNPRSILGGGRYDNLIDLFSHDDVPAVGFGAGDVTIKDFLETHNLLPDYKSTTNLYIALLSLDFVLEAEKLADILRADGVNVSIDFSDRKIGDQIKTADKHRVPYIIVIGDEEVKSGTYKLKNLGTGEEKLVKPSEISACVK